MLQIDDDHLLGNTVRLKEILPTDVPFSKEFIRLIVFYFKIPKPSFSLKRYERKIKDKLRIICIWTYYQTIENATKNYIRMINKTG